MATTEKQITPLRASAIKLVEGTTFNVVITTIVIINAVIIGFEAQFGAINPNRFATAIKVFRVLDGICLGIYIVEMLLKLFAWRGNYFRDGWNIFDFIIIVVSIIPVIGFNAQAARVFRVFRVLRLFKLVSALRSLRVIVEAIFKSIPGIMSTLVLLLIVYYIAAVIGVELYASIAPEYFGSFGKAIFTLFQLTTLESWPDVARTVLAVNPLAWIYFVTFIIIAAFIIINVILGVIINAMEAATKRAEDEQTEDISEELQDQVEDMAEQLKDHASDHMEQLQDQIQDLSGQIAQLQNQLNAVTQLLEQQSSDKAE